MVKELKRYGAQTIALDEIEKDMLEVLSIYSGIKKSTLARALFYRGIQSYLRDGKLLAAQPEAELLSDLTNKVESTKELADVYTIIKNRAGLKHRRRA